MKHRIIIAALAALTLCGCGTIANRIADAIEPRLEALVDKQIEREERMAGIWGTTNSYFYIEAQAAKAEEAAQEQAKKEEVMSVVAEMIAKNQDTLLAEVEKFVEKKIKKGK